MGAGNDMRQAAFQPLGLITAPNKYGQYPAGALSKALNVCMRDPGVLSSLPDTQAYRADVMSSGYKVRAQGLYPAASSVLALGDNGSGTHDARWVTSGASTAITAPSQLTLAFNTGKNRAHVVRDRTLIAASSGVIALDSEGDTTARMAGMWPIASYFVTSTTTTAAQVLPDGYTVAYCVLIRRDIDDHYTIISEPSYQLVYTNSSGSTIDLTLRVFLASFSRHIAGDVVEIYRTDMVAAGSSPGSTFYLAKEHAITSAEVIANHADIRDTTPEDALGRELYSNPGQEGANAAKGIPPQADDVTTFRGHTLYSSANVAAQLKYSVPGRLGVLSSAADRTYGIGTRAVTGDTTSGSPAILNVSDTTGLVAGQASLSSTYFTGTILSVVGTTVTMSTNALATQVGAALVFEDLLEVSGSSGNTSTSNMRCLRDLAAIKTDNALNKLIVSTSIQVPDDGQNLTIPTSAMDVVGVEFIIRRGFYNDGTVTLRATNGANYSPALPEIDSTVVTSNYDPRGNRVHFSLDQQPEAVPPLNYFFVGTGTIYRLISTRDCVWAFCSDGLWRISGGGNTADDWRVDPVDPTLILSARGAVAVMQDVVYAYTNRGIVSIDSVGNVQELSTAVIGDAATLPGAVYADTWNTFLACDELHREVWLTLYDGASSSTTYVYNTITKAFWTVAQSNAYSAMGYSRALQSLVIGRVDTAPDVYYFNADTSTTRMSGSDVRYQPIVGDSPDTLKEFQDVDFIFTGVGTALTLVPSFDGTNYTSTTVPVGTIESRARVAVPRNAPAVAPRLAPGFTLSAGGTANLWTLRGASVRFEGAGDEVTR